MKQFDLIKKALPAGQCRFRQVMGVLCLGIAIAAGAETAFAGWTYKTRLTFHPQYPTSYSYTQTPIDWETKTPRDPEAPLTTNEVFRVAIVQDARTNKSTLPFTLDEAGQLNLAEGVSTNEVQVAWCTLFLDEAETRPVDYITVGENPGTPDCDLDPILKWYVFHASYPEGFEAKANATVTNYLIAFDTRDGEQTCLGEPKRVSRYAVRKIANVTAAPMGSEYEIYVAPLSKAELTTIAPPGCELSSDFKTFEKDSWMDAEAITSYTVIDSETGEAKVLEGDALDAYLSPTFSSTVVASGSATVATAKLLADADSSTSSSATSGKMTLQVTSPDLIYYTLWTGSSPQADSTWQTWENFLKEKGLDISDAKAYSRFRVNEGGTELVLPRVEGEAKRFYQLRGANH